MLFLIALILAFGFAFLCGKPLKKYPYVFYAAAVVITVVTVILAGTNLHSVPVFVSTYIIGLFTRGAFATALWCVVMWAGAMPNGSAPIKKLMPIRGELSIFAALLTLGHNIGFGQTYFVRLFTDAGRMSTNQLAASILTIIMLVIMIPLTVMSFPQIRRKMNAKLWKKIQRAAYAFYGLIYIHVMVLCMPLAKSGREGYLFSIIVYSIVFIGYAICRIRKWFILRKKPENCTVLNIVCIAAFVILVAAAGFISRASVQNSTNAVSETVSPTMTTTVSSASDETTTTTKVTTTTTSSHSETSATDSTEETTTTTTEPITDNTTENQPEEEIPIENVPQQEAPVADENDQSEMPAEQPQQEEPQQVEQPEQPQEPSYIYKNGTYSASAYGYDGEVHVSVTIENDVITAISGYSDESDTWYYESAQGSVIPQILATQSTKVDAYSGATYSSNAIMSAVQKALNSAKN